MEISGDFGPLRRQLAEMQRGRSAIDIKIKADVDQASFARAKAQGGALGGKEEVKLRADVDTSSFARARAAQAVLTKESAKLGDVFNRSNLSIGQWTGILSAALPVIVDLTGALGALTASAAAATAGLGALAIGGAGAATVGFGGIAAIAAPAISSLKDLMTAQQAANKAQSTGAQSAARSQSAAAQQIKSAQEQVATATRGVTTAEEQLQQAQEQEQIAQKALTQARLDAVRQLEDMRRSAAEAGTTEKRAQLGIEQAEANLRAVRLSSSSTALDIRDAELSVTEARQNAKDVSIQASRAEQDYNKAQKKGVSEMPGVVSAQESLDSAIQSVNTAQDGVAQAHRDVAKALQNLAFQQKQANTATVAGGTSLAALQLAQKKAGPEAVKFARNLKELGQRWKGLTAAGKTDFFGLLNDGLSRVNKRLPLFAKSANESMKALREGIDAFWAKAAAGPEFKTFIKTMTDTFHKALVPIGDAFGNIVKVLERISVAVAPDLLRLFRGFDAMTQGWVDSTRNAEKLRDVIHDLVNQANTWWKLIKATADLIAAVLIPGMGKGKMAVEGITASLKGWTDWVNAHPREMRDFFKEGLKTTGQLAELLLGLLPTLFQISTAMRPIARAFLAILTGLNKLKVGSVSALTVLLGAMVSAKALKGVAAMVTSFKALKTAALGAAAAEAAAGAASAVGPRTQMGLASGKQMGLASAPMVVPKLATNTAGLASYAKVAGGAALAITALVGAVEALRTNFLGVRSVFTGFFNRVLKPLNDAFVELLNTVSGGHAGEIFATFAKAFKVLARPLAFVVRNLTKFIGLLAIGGISAAFITAIVAIVGPLYVGIKALNLFIKGLKSLKDVAKNVAGVLVSVFTAAFAQIKKVFTSGTGVALGAFKRFGGGIHDVANGIAHVFRSLYLVIKKVAVWIGNQVNKVGKALGGLKDKIPDLSLDIPGPLDIAKSVLGQQRGGFIPGVGDGDKVHVLAEPGEGFINKRAVKAMGGKRAIDRINNAIPRFQKGGVAKKGGGMTAMIAEANKFESRHFPYSWGGGHSSFGIQPVDCSGAVSDVLHAAGLLSAPMVSGSLMSWGKQGKGPLTVYANPHHVVMSLNGRVFGTSGSNPGGGAGWIDGASGSSLAPGAVRTMDVAGAIGGQIKKLLVKGTGPVKDIAQATVNKMRAMANAKLAKMAPAGAFGGGQANVYKGNLDRTFPSALGEPPPHLAPWQAAMLAERAGLPGITYAQIAHGESGFSPGAISPDGGYGLWQMTPRVQSASTVSKWHSIGSYFNPWKNALMAKVLAGSGTGVSNYFGTGFVQDANRHWHGEKKFAEGGVVGPYVGKFHEGGFVGQDGLGWLQRGETVLPQMQKGGTVERLKDEAKETRQRARKIEKQIAEETAAKDPNKKLIKHLQKLEERLHSHEALIAELLTEQKEIHRDSKERNKLLKDIRANEKGGMRAVSNFIASDIGFSQKQKSRQAGAGGVARY